MHGKLGDKVRLLHIYDAILEIESYLVNKEFTGFMENSMISICLYQTNGNHWRSEQPHI
jgi:hypothetical protein